MRPTKSILLATILTLPPLVTNAAGPADKTALLSRQNAQHSSAPTIQVYSRETVVDVMVTDADGKPVHGLKQSDFTVKEDGKQQPIRSFRETGSAPPEAVQAAPPKLPTGVYTNVHAAPDSGPVSIILLDIYDTPWEDRPYQKEATVNFLKTMPPGTQVAIFGLDGALRLLQAFTSDGIAAAAVVEAYYQSLVKRNVPVGTALPAGRLADVMNDIAAYVAGIKGRKNLMWFAAPIPIGCGPAWTDQHLAEVFDQLTSAQVAVYPLDARGLFGAPGPPRSNPLRPPVAITETTGIVAADAGMGFLLGTGCQELGMEAVAEVTGGKAYYNNNDLKSQLAQIVDRGNHYYTLTYVPPPFVNDARYHSIHIEVDRPGLHLTYRKGFAAEDPTKPPPTFGPQLMKAAMGPGIPPSTQLLFDVKVEPSNEPENPFDPPVLGLLDARFKKASLARYSFLFAIPVSQIAFADAPGGNRSGSIEFDVAAYDPGGKLATLRSQTMKLPLTADEYQQFLKTPFQFLQQIDLPPGQFTLRIGILDGTSNKVGTLEIPLTVAGRTPQQAAAQPKR